MEGVAQTLLSSGFRVACARSREEAAMSIAEELPLILLVASDQTIRHPELLLLPRLPGGASILWYSVPGTEAPLASSVRRHALAELRLPLERQRLVALARHVAERAAKSGRLGDLSHPELPPGT